MVNEKLIPLVSPGEKKRMYLYSASIAQRVTLTAGTSTSCTFTFGSDNVILMAELTSAWPASTWANALVTVSRTTINRNVVTLDLTTNATQDYTVTVTALYYLD